MQMPFPQRSVPVLERQAPWGGLIGEPNLSLPKDQLYAGYLFDYCVRPLSYLTMQGQLVTDEQIDAFIETFHLKYSLSIFQKKKNIILYPRWTAGHTTTANKRSNFRRG